MEDILIKKFFEKERWKKAIDVGIDKDINKTLLRELCSPDTRLDIYYKIKNREYRIAPPHEAAIPKDDGTMRIVYVNEDIDRILLSIFNDMIFELCPEMVHPSCMSYQHGIGCGKIVQQVSKTIRHMNSDVIGKKIDLSKYFDSVPLPYIDGVFEAIQTKFGKSALLDTVWDYYHDTTVIDLEKNTISKYSSLKQGCAFAAFLADAVLYEIDKEMSDMNVMYVRYSDDILLVGQDWQCAFNVLASRLNDMALTLNPKKIETLYKHKWFNFLGFAIKDDQISLSKNRIKSFQKEIERRTLYKPSKNIKQTLDNVYQYLYKGDGNFSWATSVLPIVTVDEDINTLNTFVMDAIRASYTGKTKIGGLGSVKNVSNRTIVRGKGKNVKMNRTKVEFIPDYMTIKCMRNALMTSKEAFATLVATL